MAEIVLADNQVILREGIRALIDQIEDWSVVGEASDGFELLPLVQTHSPDIVILELSMPNLGGLEAINRLMRLADSPPILVLSAKSDDLSISEALKAGAMGYLTKDSDSEELKFAIRALLGGKSYLSPEVAHRVLTHSNEDEIPLCALSSREREVMKLLSEGKANREVAKLLHISPRTVDSHRANIMKKLGVKSNAAMVQLALEFGMI